MEKVEPEQTMTYKTVFQNEHFIIVDKAANVLSVPSRMGIEDNRPCLGHILQLDLGQTIYPVHRLDFEVSGLIIFALTKKAQSSSNTWFENKSISKVYSALTVSSKVFTIGETYEWKCILLRGKKRAYESPHGKESLTRARLVSVDESGQALWELRPITGRSHQLRYELFRHGEVIIGDSLYGSTEKFTNEAIALRAYQIDFGKVVNREEFKLPEIISIKSF
ncbi:MAG: RNA pseudouridine synthase [Bacteriovorax sp.]|nr:RNA pseudouridine synthase [Bacteriovorax sp.]